VERASREISERSGREPTVNELAQYLEMTPEEVLDGLDAGAAHYATSLEAPIVGADEDAPG
jgi:RNA polymerase sigma-B factor